MSNSDALLLYSPAIKGVVNMRLLGSIFWLGVLALLLGLPKVVGWLLVLFLVVLLLRMPLSFLFGAILGIALFRKDDC